MTWGMGKYVELNGNARSWECSCVIALISTFTTTRYQVRQILDPAQHNYACVFMTEQVKMGQFLHISF